MADTYETKQGQAIEKTLCVSLFDKPGLLSDVLLNYYCPFSRGPSRQSELTGGREEGMHPRSLIERTARRDKTFAAAQRCAEDDSNY